MTTRTNWAAPIALMVAVTTLASAASIDPRMSRVAEGLESADLTPFFQQVSYTEWTKSVLQGLTLKERKRIAEAVRSRKKSELREGHLEQYRAVWRSSDLPDSEFIVTFSMMSGAGQLEKPMIAFGSRLEKIPELLADALEKDQMPLVTSFHQALSPWLYTLSRLTPTDRKNLVDYYRSLRLIKKQPGVRVWKGPYVTPSGLLVQNELSLQLQQDGRWLID